MEKLTEEEKELIRKATKIEEVTKDDIMEYYNEKLQTYWFEAGYYNRNKNVTLDKILRLVKKAYDLGYKEGVESAKKENNSA